MIKEIEDILKQSIIVENTLKLPNIVLHRKTYLNVKKEIEKIGGKWKGGKVSAFIFSESPKNLLNEILNGKKINLKKDFQFFETPLNICEKLVDLADLSDDNLTILEPSAGQGAIIECLKKILPNNIINYYELMPQNLKILQKKNLNINYLGDDFLKHKNQKFDRIIANPPFTKNQDIIHFMKMYESLNKNGILICITSTSWKNRKQKKQIDFQNFLNKNNAKIIEIPGGNFKSSGTNIATLIVKIVK